VAAIQDRVADRLPIGEIQPSPRNPRQRVEMIAELADSMRAHGQLQPIVVRPLAGGYEMIAGHRRLEAARLLGWTEIAAVVRDETDDQAYILMLVENLQREDLTPKEEAAALEVLVRERKWSLRKVAEQIKRSHVYVSKRLRVFDDPSLAPLVLTNKMPVSTAEELLRVTDDNKRTEFARHAIDERWGQAEARRTVREWKVTYHSDGPDRSGPRLAARIRALADELTEFEVATLSTREQREVRHLLDVLSRLQPGRT